MLSDGFVRSSISKRVDSTLNTCNCKNNYYQRGQKNGLATSVLMFQVKEWIECCGVEYALEMTYNATKPFTPSWHEDTLRGMVRRTSRRYMGYCAVYLVPSVVQADGSGASFKAVAMVAMIPEVCHRDSVSPGPSSLCCSFFDIHSSRKRRAA